MAKDSELTPVIIIGAPRSGTNMLRNAICSMSGFGTWPCDEINYMWRYGNRSYPSDEIPLSLLHPASIRYIRGQFLKIKKYTQCKNIVEKTCANSLRVPYVDGILPNAKIIFLYRDGRDVVSSAIKKWNSPSNLSYMIAKLRFVPNRDMLFYVNSYILNRLKGFSLNDKRRVFLWGPRFHKMNEIANSMGLPAVCAAQWSRCVLLAKSAIQKMDKERICEIKYENFVSRPESEFLRLADFLGAAPSQNDIDKTIKAISSESVGSGRAALGFEKINGLKEFLKPALESCGYEW
jgi:hypothetical protein